MRDFNKLEKIEGPLGFSPENRIRKTDLLANAWEKHALLCDRINEFNEVLTAARASVEAAWADYAKAAGDLESFKEAMREEQLRMLAADEERSERDESTLEWLGLWAAFQARVPQLALPTSVTPPDDDLLSYFEELPDSP